MIYTATDNELRNSYFRKSRSRVLHCRSDSLNFCYDHLKFAEFEERETGERLFAVIKIRFEELIRDILSISERKHSQPGIKKAGPKLNLLCIS